jgi:hypothetical protein
MSTESIVVTMDAQEIGSLYAQGYDPRQFKRLLLAKLRQAGAPVEGVLEPKLAHGAVYKMRETEPTERFRYIWLPEALDESLRRFSDNSGLAFDAEASAVV